jgi:phenylacetate-CoA ligase
MRVRVTFTRKRCQTNSAFYLTMAPKALAVGLGAGRNAWLLPLDVTFKTIGLRYGWLKTLFDHAPPGPLAMTGRLRAERAAWRAVRHVPGYRAYLREQGVSVDTLVPAGILEKLPETDKRSYIDRYPLAERCLGGKFPFRGTTIDESSGSTGTPYNWIRSEAERHIAHRNISFFARYCFGPEPLVTINAFSMGAWATGFNMTLALNRNGIVKSTGPDIEKILSTLRFLGPGYRYLIMGYPPFVKHLLDEGDRAGIGWEAYNMHAMVGGEGMTEELRDHLLGRFVSVFSGYGATDIEIGMAGESPASVAIRRVARARPELRRALFGDDSRLPMVFQYNPLIHYLETNPERELICTISRLDVLAPRIRYNVHDEGGILDYGQVSGKFRDFGLDLAQLGKEKDVAGPRGSLPWVQPVQLPFLWIFGRRDATISVMGANIYPEDIEVLIYRDREVTAAVHSFCLSVVTDATSTPRPCIALELNDGHVFDEAGRDRLAAQFQTGLQGLNLDYRAALAEFPAAMLPIVQTYSRGEGPFRLDAGRIKQRRIAA